MISTFSLYNLAVWASQVLVITSIGAALPFAFRIHHPRSTLVYYRLLLLVPFLLPFILPVQRDVVFVPTPLVVAQAVAPSDASISSSPASAHWSWPATILLLIGLGTLVRIGWLAGGLWQLKRLKNSSSPLHPTPHAIQVAREITKTDAMFCVSDGVKGPVTFGFFRPVVLLPKSFSEMSVDAQTIVASHELWHVRRHDWLQTMGEQLIASFLWFQPAVWWLIAQSQLAREQLVDAEVVSATASRESYIQTLFSLAEARWEADLGVASLFLRRRHLIHRVHSLLMEVSMSRIRLVSSYSVIAAILAFGSARMFHALPLTGEAELRQAAPEAQAPSQAQSSVGYVVNRTPITYPAEALQKRIEGQVVVELTFNAQGEIVDSRVLSGPEALRQAGLQTALQGKYDINLARTLQVVVDFKLPAPGQRGLVPVAPGTGPGPRGGARGGVAPGTAVAPGLGPIPPPVVPPTPTGRVRVGGRVAANNLVTTVPPVYPQAAQDANVRGAVVLEAEINKEGKVMNLKVIDGHPLLIQAAIEAVKQWVYRPLMLNGQPVEVVTTITVDIP
jgi:TonB family protein